MQEPLVHHRKRGVRWKLALLPFRSAAVRDAALWSSKALYRTGRYLGSGWRATVLFVLAVAGAWWLWHAILEPPVPLVSLLVPEIAAQVLIAAALLAILRWALRTRRHTVIAGFENFTGDDRNNAAVRGISALLCEELERIAELYRTIDEGWPTAIGSRDAVEATVMVGNIDNALQGAISATSEVHLGPLKIPVGALLVPISRLLKGPRITGSIHLEGDQPILLAHLEGRGSFQWCVSPSDIEDGAPRAELLDRMVEQLACRVFTDLVSIGSRNWKAVKFYTHGLRHWRSTIQTQKERLLRLHRAEEAFITALAEDNGFARCHYNLGIVYRDLHDTDAAMAAFLRAVQTDPEQGDAWYALASMHDMAGHHDDALRLFDRAISVNPDDPRPWDFYSLSERRAEKLKRGHTPGPDEAPAFWERVHCKRTIAVALAWKALAWASLRGRREHRAHQTAAVCTQNLAIACAQRDRMQQAETVFRQAIHLAPNDANIYFELGKVRASCERWSDAVRAFENSVSLNDIPLTWVRLAVAHAKTANTSSGPNAEHHHAAALRACAHALDDGSALTAELVKEVFEAYTTLGHEKEAALMAALFVLLDQKKLKRGRDETPTQFEQRMKDLAEVSPDWDWLRAQTEILLANQNIHSNAPAAEEQLREAIRRLEPEHPKEIRNRGLHGLLARACLNQGKLMDALEHAQKAVSLEPEGFWERSILGDVYLSLNDYERAEHEYRISLALKPSNEARIQLTLTSWSRGGMMLDPVRRRGEFERVMAGLRELLEQAPLDRGWAHYWLGKFHGELLQFDDSIYHLTAAQHMSFKPLEAHLDRAWTYVQAHAWSEAEQAVHDALDEAWRQVTARPFQRPEPVYGEDVPINENLARAWLVLAYCWANREVNLEQAVFLTRLAERRIERITPSQKRSRFLASLADCRGWVHYKQGALDEAVTDLEGSVALIADTGSYYHLARVYLARAEYSRCPDAWIAKAHRASMQARENDLSGEYRRDLGGLEQEIRMFSSRSASQPVSLA